ncbi:MAG: DNA-3-methyladenine glycosylase [Phycisphaerae bacterium]
MNVLAFSEYGGRKTERAFFRRGAEVVARELLGAALVRTVDGVRRAALITETEAYVGTHDLACHASKGRTRRTEIMFGPAGYAYVYLIYGMYHMFNIVTAEEGDAQAVLLRGAVPLDDWDVVLSGPGKLTRAFGITLADRGLDLTGDDLYIMKNPQYNLKIMTTPRIGIDYAGEWKNAPLRFVGATLRTTVQRHGLGIYKQRR